jgi:hypothetical protein
VSTLGENYLTERGLTLDFAFANGVELDPAPDRGRIIERLAQNCVPLWHLA